jgi:AAHS family 4-hydroxybenzoate transporter-like MFS transporter
VVFSVTDSAVRIRTVSEIIDEHPLGGFQIKTMTLCALVVIFDGFDTQSIGFLVPYISESLKIPLSAFGPVLAAGLLGLMIAAMATGPIADRFGRKWTVIVSTLTFATFAIATARSTSLSQLILFRFLTGLGLGGALPNVIALASEYAPRRLLRTVVSTLSGGMAIGALVAGVASSLMIPHWGWQSVLYLGGGVPIVITLVLIKGLPESVRFLTVRGHDPRRVSQIIARISPELAEMPIARPTPSTKIAATGIPVTHLFTEGRAGFTVLLWIVFFMNLLTLYFIVSWLPALLRQSGMARSAGVTAISLFSIAGFTGAATQGPLMDRVNAHGVLLVQFIMSAALVASMSYTTSYVSIMAVMLALGYFLNGAQSGLNAVAAGFYPTAIRSTGIGWALAVGRIGSIVGPLLAGALLTKAWTPQEIFLAGAVPALCGALALALAWMARMTVRSLALES